MPEQKATTTTTATTVKMKASASAAAPVDDLLNTKLREMSVKERSDGLHDLHGVAETLPEETPEMLRTKVQELNQALPVACADTASSNASYYYYQQAVLLDPDYVERLKVPFLRSEAYHTTRAAERMIRFFARKVELFGEQMLVKDITQRDCLDDEDMAALQAGAVHVLSHRDRVGRGVFLIHAKINHQHSTKAVSKVFFYMVMAAMQDKDTQRNGVVFIYYGNGIQKVIPGRAKESLKSSFALPWRETAVHFCGDKQAEVSSSLSSSSSSQQQHSPPAINNNNNNNSNAMNQVTYQVIEPLDNTLLCRTRRHFGTDIECIYNLMTFGIPKEVFPIADDGSVNLEYHLAMLEMLKCREERMNNNTNNNNQKTRTRVTATTDTATDTTPRPVTTMSSGRSSSNGENLNVPMPPTTTSASDGAAAATTTTATTTEDNATDIDNDAPLTTTMTSNSSSSNGGDLVILPRPMDIVLGKGKHPNSSVGSLRMHHLLLEHAQEYEESSKFDKTIIGDIVLRKLELCGCRFLKPTPSGFQICSESVARTKISHAFRNRRVKRMRKMAASSATEPSTGTCKNKKNNKRGAAGAKKATTSTTTTTTASPLEGKFQRVRATSPVKTNSKKRERLR